MAALKGAEIDAYVAQPDARRIALVYGVDAGLVRERVEALLRAAVDDLADPFSLVRIEGDMLASHPARLLEEAHTAPLFGGRRALWVKSGGSNIAGAVEALLADPPEADCRVVIEAGDLRKGAPLRALLEQAKGGVALACYADGERELARVIAEELRPAQLSIAPDAQALLVSLLGGDRQASRNEIRKLALHAHGKARVEARRCPRGRGGCVAIRRGFRGGCGLCRARSGARQPICAGAHGRHNRRNDIERGGAAGGATASGAIGDRSRRQHRRRYPGKLPAAALFPPRTAGEGGARRLDRRPPRTDHGPARGGNACGAPLADRRRGDDASRAAFNRDDRAGRGIGQSLRASAAGRPASVTPAATCPSTLPRPLQAPQHVFELVEAAVMDMQHAGVPLVHDADGQSERIRHALLQGERIRILDDARTRTPG